MESIKKAINWINLNQVDDILVYSNVKPTPYPLSSGIAIEALFKFGDMDNSNKMADAIITFQPRSGGWRTNLIEAAFDKRVVFDTAQIINSLVLFDKYRTNIMAALCFIKKYTMSDNLVSLSHTMEYYHRGTNAMVGNVLVKVGIFMPDFECYKLGAKILNRYFDLGETFVFKDHLSYGFILQAYLETPLFKKKVMKLVDIVIKQQQEDGSFIDEHKNVLMSAIAQYAIVLYRAGFYKNSKKCIDYLINHQDENGGFTENGQQLSLPVVLFLRARDITRDIERKINGNPTTSSTH